jgi:hypothetical protein
MSDRPNTVTGLLEKRREIAGKIEHSQREPRNLVIMLDHLDFTIRMFDPDADLGTPTHYPRAHQAFKGEMARYVLGTLGEADGRRVTSLEIAEKVIAGRALVADQMTTILIRKRVGAALWKYGHRGIAREVPMTGELKGWAD